MTGQVAQLAWALWAGWQVGLFCLNVQGAKASKTDFVAEIFTWWQFCQDKGAFKPEHVGVFYSVLCFMAFVKTHKIGLNLDSLRPFAINLVSAYQCTALQLPKALEKSEKLAKTINVCSFYNFLPIFVAFYQFFQLLRVCTGFANFYRHALWLLLLCSRKSHANICFYGCNNW